MLAQVMSAFQVQCLDILHLANQYRRINYKLNSHGSKAIITHLVHNEIKGSS
jgi:hypothetical protein